MDEPRAWQHFMKANTINRLTPTFIQVEGPSTTASRFHQTNRGMMRTIAMIKWKGFNL